MVTPLLWAIIGAGTYFLLSVAFAVIVDLETREAVTRILCIPAVVIVWPFVQTIELLPKVGRLRAAGIAEEIRNRRIERIAWGAAGRRWCVVAVRRLSDEHAPPIERVP